MISPHLVANAVITDQLPFRDIAEDEGGLHLPAHLAADDLFFVKKIPAVGTVVVVLDPVLDALQVEVVSAAGSHHCLILQADRALRAGQKLCLPWNPDGWNNFDNVALEDRSRWRRRWSKYLVG